MKLRLHLLLLAVAFFGSHVGILLLKLALHELQLQRPATMGLRLAHRWRIDIEQKLVDVRHVGNRMLLQRLGLLRLVLQAAMVIISFIKVIVVVVSRVYVIEYQFWTILGSSSGASGGCCRRTVNELQLLLVTLSIVYAQILKRLVEHRLLLF